MPADQPSFSWTVIATTGERFSDFEPYVAAVNDAGTVAFEGALRSGGTGVFTGSGGPLLEEFVCPTHVTRVISHPDVNSAGHTSFYGDLADGRQGVFLHQDGRFQTIAVTDDAFSRIGPLGPTMNDAGGVAFRADRSRGVSGIFFWDGAAITTVADTLGGWRQFYGLPVISENGVVIFRADRNDGAQGIYAYEAGSVRPVAETGDQFETLAHFPSVDDVGRVAFVATLREGSSVVVEAYEDRLAVIDDEGAFESSRGALLTGRGTVVRIATPPGGGMGLFAGPDPYEHRILALGDALLGSIIVDFAANPVSVNATGHVAVRATLADDRQFILRADPASTSEAARSDAPRYEADQ